jgi:hypothetical protein
LDLQFLSDLEDVGFEHWEGRMGMRDQESNGLG